MRFRKEVGGRALTGRRDRLRPQDLAVLAHEHRGAIRDPGLFQPGAGGLGHGSFRVKVGQEGKVDSTEAVGPGLVAELAVNGDTQHLGIGGLELREQRVEAGNLNASSRGEVEWIEDQEQVLLPGKVLGADLVAFVAVQLERRQLCSGLDQGHGVRKERAEGLAQKSYPGRRPLRHGASAAWPGSLAPARDICSRGESLPGRWVRRQCVAT